MGIDLSISLFTIIDDNGDEWWFSKRALMQPKRPVLSTGDAFYEKLGWSYSANPKKRLTPEAKRKYLQELRKQQSVIYDHFVIY